MGRLLVFLARIVHDGKAAEGRAIAIDERTAALVSAGGAVTIAGDGPVYFVRTTSRPEICKAGVPLTLQTVSVYRCTRGNTFDLKAWSGGGGVAYTLSVDAGTVTSSQTGGSIY